MATIELARSIILDQYSAKDLAEGEAYADAQGYADAEEFFSLAMAKILYGASDLESGARYPVEPGSLDEHFEDAA
jgi:hypothetical protein